MEHHPDRLRYPIAPWIGRLILPDHRPTEDEVKVEVYHAPSAHQRLIGQIVTLQWTSAPTTQAFVQSVLRDIRFDAIARSSMAKGRVHPIRLDGLKRVGPLESLAGARDRDDVEVILQDPVVMSEPGGDTTLVIAQEPIQVTGIVYCVVTIRASLVDNANVDNANVDNNHSSGDMDNVQATPRFLVQHYNPSTQKFDGWQEVMRIPDGPLNAVGLYRFTNRHIEYSLANQTGWYVYGYVDDDGMFVVQSIEPYSSLALTPDRVLLGDHQGSHYIDVENWAHTSTKGGTLETVLIDSTATNAEEAIAQWKEGDRLLVIHLYGGIGGKQQDEKRILGLVTGHFSYGVATVVRDPLTQTLRFDMDYHQVYAHNSDGIISGPSKRCGYMGDLKRGWLNLRPISDMVIKFDCVTQDYDFGSVHLSPLTTFLEQLQIMTARYRVGDGTGASMVDAARCCVQDSSQALYVALQHNEDEIESNPDIQTWLKAHPHDPQTRRFRQLQKFGAALRRNLVPLGIVRSDWRENADSLTGIAYPSQQESHNLLGIIIRALASWRTMLPRRCHDEMAKLLLKHGAKLWFIRTNQVGGINADTIPYAPTTLIGGLRGKNE